MTFALGFLGVSIVTWLGSAFCLEMKGMAVHLQVWLASIGFFIANVNLLRVILTNYRGFDSNNQIHRKEKTN
jgi:phosphatidylinositol glycan class M